MGNQELGERAWDEKLRFPIILGELVENTHTIQLLGVSATL